MGKSPKKKAFSRVLGRFLIRSWKILEKSEKLPISGVFKVGNFPSSRDKIREKSKFLGYFQTEVGKKISLIQKTFQHFRTLENVAQSWKVCAPFLQSFLKFTAEIPCLVYLSPRPNCVSVVPERRGHQRAVARCVSYLSARASSVLSMREE